MTPAIWSVEEAAARLEEVIEQARKRGPQVIQVQGQPVASIVAEADRHPETGRGSLADFFAASPLAASGIEIERSTDPPRDVDV